MERVGHRDEVRGLVGGVGVDRAGQHLRLVGHDRHRLAAEVGERADHRPAEAGLDLEPVAVVEHHVEHRRACRRPAGCRAARCRAVRRSAAAPGRRRHGAVGYDQALDGK